MLSHTYPRKTDKKAKLCICWAMFRKPQPLQLVQKVRQYTSNLYGSTPPICIAVLSWLLSFEERETLQYASHLYCSTPPICTAVRAPFVRQYFWKNTGGWGHRNVSDSALSQKFWPKTPYLKKNSKNSKTTTRPVLEIGFLCGTRALQV